jgi:phosphoenolpyruvate carboxykinase (GTP)
MAATMGSEATAAAIGQEAIRRDPFAMLPFIGYNMAEYWAHWLKMGERTDLKLPGIFRVNWFRKDENGKFIWPGYGENMRVLKWIVDRVRGRADASKSAFGLMPRYDDITWGSTPFSKEKFLLLTEVGRDAVTAEAEALKGFLAKFGKSLPPEMERQRQALADRAK